MYFIKSGKFLNFKNHSDGKFYKTRFVGLGNIGTYIKFGGFVFKNKKVVTCRAKMGGALWQRETPNHLDGNFYKIRF